MIKWLSFQHLVKNGSDLNELVMLKSFMATQTLMTQVAFFLLNFLELF